MDQGLLDVKSCKPAAMYKPGINEGYKSEVDGPRGNVYVGDRETKNQVQRVCSRSRDQSCISAGN